jgi:hypothetical protein
VYYATGLTGWQRAGGWWPGAYAPPGPYPVPVAPPEMSSAQELSALRSEVTFMEDALKKAQERIAELEKETKDQ